MSEVALRWMNGEGMLVQAGADLLADDSLTTTVLLCLFTDRRAEVSDSLPDGGHDWRGWWADSSGRDRLARGCGCCQGKRRCRAGCG